MTAELARFAEAASVGHVLLAEPMMQSLLR
jgi:hypothetical protein